MMEQIALIVFFSYIIMVIYFFFRQEGMVYMPRRKLNNTPSSIGLPYRDVYFKTSDGLELHGWLVEPVGHGSEFHGQKPVILFCHGTGGNISHRLETLIIFSYLGLRTFIFDYRGYGLSQGKPTEEGTALDAQAAWKYLTQKENIPAQHIILFGRSLGGAVAANLAATAKINPAGLVLESTFTSIPDLGKQKLPFLPVHLLSRFQYNTCKLLPDIHLPILIIHSPQDEMVPFKNSIKLFKTANEPKQFLAINGSHDRGFLESKEIYIEGLKAFFRLSLDLRFKMV